MFLEVKIKDAGGTMNAEISLGGKCIGEFAMHTRYEDLARTRACHIIAEAFGSGITYAMEKEGCEKVA